MTSCMVATPEARSREQGGERDDHGVTEPDGSGGRIDMAGAAVVPKAGTELAEASGEDTEECGNDQGNRGHTPRVGIPRGRVRPVVSGEGLAHKQREELHRSQAGMFVT